MLQSVSFQAANCLKSSDDGHHTLKKKTLEDLVDFVKPSLAHH